MQCKEIKKHLSKYIDNEYISREKQTIENHLAACKDCQKELEQLKTLWQQLDSFESIKPGPWAFTRCQAALDQGEKRCHWFSRTTKLLIPVSSVTVAALGFWLGSLTWQKTPDTKQNETVIDYYEATVEEYSNTSLSSIYLQMASAENGGINHE